MIEPWLVAVGLIMIAIPFVVVGLTDGFSIDRPRRDTSGIHFFDLTERERVERIGRMLQRFADDTAADVLIHKAMIEARRAERIH